MNFITKKLKTIRRIVTFLSLLIFIIGLFFSPYNYYMFYVRMISLFIFLSGFSYENLSAFRTVLRRRFSTYQTIRDIIIDILFVASFCVTILFLSNLLIDYSEYKTHNTSNPIEILYYDKYDNFILGFDALDKNYDITIVEDTNTSLILELDYRYNVCHESKNVINCFDGSDIVDYSSAVRVEVTYNNNSIETYMISRENRGYYYGSSTGYDDVCNFDTSISAIDYSNKDTGVVTYTDFAQSSSSMNCLQSELHSIDLSTLNFYTYTDEVITLTTVFEDEEFFIYKTGYSDRTIGNIDETYDNLLILNGTYTQVTPDQYMYRTYNDTSYTDHTVTTSSNSNKINIQSIGYNIETNEVYTEYTSEYINKHSLYILNDYENYNYAPSYGKSSNATYSDFNDHTIYTLIESYNNKSYSNTYQYKLQTKNSLTEVVKYDSTITFIDYLTRNIEDGIFHYGFDQISNMNNRGLDDTSIIQHLYRKPYLYFDTFKEPYFIEIIKNNN